MEIKIRQSKNADTRSAETPITKEILYESSLQHIADVQKAMLWMMEIFAANSLKHDWTKVDEAVIEQFYQDFKAAQQDKTVKFIELPWYKRHITEERHHPLNYVHDDINLFDILEQVADIVMAGMARTGKVYGADISPDILMKAYHNTIELLKNNTEVEL